MPFFFSCLSVTQDNLYNTLSYCNTKSNWRYKPSVYCVCYKPRQRYVDKISAEAASDKLIKNESLFNKFKAKKNYKVYGLSRYVFISTMSYKYRYFGVPVTSS